MNTNSITYEDIHDLFLWRSQNIGLTNQMKDFIQQEFSFSNFNEKNRQRISLEKKNFPIVVPESKLTTKILKELENNSNIKISQNIIDRVKFSFGMSYWDLLRLRNGKINQLVDAVVFAINPEGLKHVISIANENNIIIIPSGGRTSVTEALEPTENNRITLAINLALMNKFIEIFANDNIAQVESGILLPDLEKKLSEHGFKFGHSPQSFMNTTLGGAISASGAGQLSSYYGPISHLIKGFSVETPIGTINNKNYLIPESAVGPNITDLYFGAEGALGIISEVFIKIKPVQELKFFSFLFKSFYDGIQAIRTFYQTGIRPAVVRLSDKEETRLFLKMSSDTEERLVDKLFKEAASFYLKRKGFISDHQCLLIIIFDGIEAIISVQGKLLSNICKKFEGVPLGSSPAKSWYNDRYQLPYYRNNFMELGIIVDTLETSASWDKLPRLYRAVIEHLKEFCKLVMAHISHVYPEGAAIYFTFLGEETYNWEKPLILEIRNRIIPIFLSHGGTISHHHGVGNAFKEYLLLERNANDIEILKTLKQKIDPKNILNPASGLLPRENII